MPFEAFLKFIKASFEASNYKSAPYYAGMFWAVKAVRHWRDPKRASWFEDAIVAESDWASDLHTGPQAAITKALLGEREPVRSVRSLKQVMRARVTITVGDWVLVQDAGANFITRVRDMVQACIHSDDRNVLVVRLWCTGYTVPMAGLSDEMWAKKPDYGAAHLVKYEYSHVTVVQRSEHAAYDVYSM
jgi:hypothetical protein